MQPCGRRLASPGSLAEQRPCACAKLCPGSSRRLICLPLKAQHSANLRKGKTLMALNLFILNDAPYGTERSYNGLRLAGALAKRSEEAVRVLLIGDAARCAHDPQRLPAGHNNIEVTIKTGIRLGGAVGVCASCMDARGISDSDLIEGTHRSSMDELATWTAEAHKVLVF